MLAVKILFIQFYVLVGNRRQVALVNRGGLENICKDDKLYGAICKVNLSDLKTRGQHCYIKAYDRKIKLKDSLEETCLKVNCILEFFTLGTHVALRTKTKCKVDAFFMKQII